MDLYEQLEKLQMENAALNEQVAHLQNDVEFTTVARVKDYKQQSATITQQAAVIEQMREALENHSGNYKLTKAECKAINEVLALQPSPEILEARDQRIAEACEKLCLHEASIAMSDGDTELAKGETWCASAIRNGEWKEYL